MATGREIQLTKQIGKYLVAAKLCRRGLISITFTGNVPNFNIIATNAKGKSVPIQVKTIRSNSWQFQVNKFLSIDKVILNG